MIGSTGGVTLSSGTVRVTKSGINGSIAGDVVNINNGTLESAGVRAKKQPALAMEGSAGVKWRG